MNDLATLREFRENDGILRLLKKHVVSGIGVIPFVGAGMSASSGFPLWTEFLQRQAQLQEMEEAITLRLRHGEYEEAAEDLLVARTFRRFEDAIQIAFDQEIDPAGIQGAVARLPFLTTGPVITTNFDSLLEVAFQSANRSFDRIVVGRRLADAYQAFNLNQRVLIKLHGDCASASDRVLTLSEYTSAYGNADPSKIDLSLPLPRFLRRALQGRPLLFLGCSLSQDRTLRVLKTVVAADSGVFHFALVPLPRDQSQILKRDAFLAEHGIRPIWYPSGEHQFIDVVLEHLLSARNPERTTRIVPAVTWSRPAPIIFGTALFGSQLNAVANVSGKFAYTPPPGTVLLAGNEQKLLAAFEPTDTAKYESVTAVTTIDVTKAMPAITWDAPAATIYQIPLSATQLNATANIAGVFAYSPPVGSYLPAGKGHELTVVFYPTDTANYESVTVVTTIDVTKAMPAITWDAPAAIIQGILLSSTQLNATANIAGAFAYNPPPGSSLPAGRGHPLSVIFTPSDTANYESATAVNTIDIAKAFSGLSIRVAVPWLALVVFLALLIKLPNPTSPPTPVDIPETRLAAIPSTDRVATISSDHRWLAVSDQNGHSSLLDLLAVTPIPRQLKTFVSPVLAVFSTDSGVDTRLVTVRNNKVVLVDATSGESHGLPTSTEFKGQVELVEFSPDGKIVAYATDEGEIGIQRTDGISPPRKLPDLAEANHVHIAALAFNRSGTRLAAASILAASVTIYNVSDVDRISLMHRLVQSDSMPFLPKSLAFDTQGAWLATGDLLDGTVRIWNVDTQTVEQQFSGSVGAVEALSFNADTRWLVATGEEGSLTIWNVKAKEATRFFPSSAVANFFAVFFGPTLYTTAMLAPRGQAGLLVRVSDNAGGLPNMKCGVDGRLSRVSDERGVCFFPDLRGKHEIQINSGEKRSLDISTPTVVSVAVPSDPHEWQLPKKPN